MQTPTKSLHSATHIIPDLIFANYFLPIMIQFLLLILVAIGEAHVFGAVKGNSKYVDPFIGTGFVAFSVGFIL